MVILSCRVSATSTSFDSEDRVLTQPSDQFRDKKRQSLGSKLKTETIEYLCSLVPVRSHSSRNFTPLIFCKWSILTIVLTDCNTLFREHVTEHVSFCSYSSSIHR